jgi:calcium uniporter protein, mitochondrial
LTRRLTVDIGKLLTTPSRLLKLILPLTTMDRNSDRKDIEPLALLVHPQQPLSYLERLIQSELPTIKDDKGADKVPKVTFRARQADEDEIRPRTKSTEEIERETKQAREEEGEAGNEEAAKKEDGEKEAIEEEDRKEAKKEEVSKEVASETESTDGKPPDKSSKKEPAKKDDSQLGDGGVASYSGAGRESEEDNDSPFVRWSSSTEIGDFIRDAARAKEFEVEIENTQEPIHVAVPSFNDRTYYLRMRLRKTAKKLIDMAGIKKECDIAAHKGGQRVAMAGFGILAGWWYVVYRLTFETDLGWDTVEPVTYLVGLSTLMGGYLWFLYHNREVSYRSALNFTISRRQTKLYQQKGFDMPRWEALIEEGNALRREIKSVAAEYDVEWDERADEQDREVTKALKKDRDENKKESGKKKSKDNDDEGDD